MNTVDFMVKIVFSEDHPQPYYQLWIGNRKMHEFFDWITLDAETLEMYVIQTNHAYDVVFFLDGNSVRCWMDALSSVSMIPIGQLE
jgi:hypothetical protein